MDERTAQAIVEAVLRDLQDRNGFDEWWAEVTTDVREEMMLELRDVVQDAAS